MSSYNKILAQRARSTSRKRGHDETEAAESSISYNPYSSPGPARANISPNSPSSSNSNGIASPAMSSLDSPAIETSPRLAAGPAYNYNGVPLSPLHVPPQARYDYDYGSYQSPLAQSNPSPWSADNTDQGGLDMFPSNSQMQYSYGEPLSAVDSNYLGYSGTSDLNGGLSSGLSTTPPTASFDAPGLPFRGLDYIRNYNPGGYSAISDHDSLWQSFDAGAFGFDPELPFTLPDLSPNSLEAHHHQ